MTQDFPFEKFLKNQEYKTNKNKDLLENIFNSPKSEKEEVVVQNERSPGVNALEPITTGLFEILESKVEKIKFDTFIKNKIELLEITNEEANFVAQTKFIKSTIENSYIDSIQKALLELMGTNYRINIVVRTENHPIFNNLIIDDAIIPKKSNKPSFTLDLSPKTNEVADQAQSRFLDHMEKETSGKTIDPKKNFENYIVGPSNNLAFATASAVSDSPGITGKYPCLYIYSDSGLGKTHLLHAIANGVFENHPDLAVCLISARDFMKELINAYKDKTLNEFQRKYTESIDVLMIDDIHELKNKNSTQEEFFHIFNFLHDKGKQLIFTSDKSPDKITGIEERIITRLQWGLVIDIQKPDFETRTAILKKKAVELDLFVQDEVLNLIASSIKSSIRELEGSLIRLQAHAELMEAEIDTEMARDILKLQDLNEKPAATLESVCRASSQYFKIAVADLKSKSRNKDIVRARHIAWYLSKNIVGVTFKEIAQYYSNRDHSSVIHGVNKISNNLKNDPKLSKDLIFLENSI